MYNYNDYYQKTNLPDYSTIQINAINILSHDESLPVRLLDLKGTKVRFYINKTNNNVHYNIDDKVEPETMLKYQETFKQLMNNFFFGDTYIYCVLKNNILYIYDIYTNNNWLSLKDMLKIQNEYNYGNIGFNVLPPIVSGIVPTSKLLEAIVSSTNQKYLKLFHEVYIEYETEEKVVDNSKKDILFYGTEPTYSYNNNYNYYNDDYYNDGYSYGYNYKPKKKVEVVTLNKVSSIKEFKDVSKESRSTLFKETNKNVNDYIEKNNIELTAEETKVKMIICYLYSLNCSMTTRKYLYDYYNEEFCIDANNFHLIQEELDDVKLLSHVFQQYWFKEFKSLISKNLRTLIKPETIYKLLKEELEVFYTFYKNENVVNCL